LSRLALALYSTITKRGILGPYPTKTNALEGRILALMTFLFRNDPKIRLRYLHPKNKKNPVYRTQGFSHWDFLTYSLVPFKFSATILPFSLRRGIVDPEGLIKEGHTRME
jgi:hypothetical protein